MSKSVFVIAVIAAACSSVAFAGEVKKDRAPVVKATTMTNAELERVSAGAALNVFRDETNTITLKETGSRAPFPDGHNPGGFFPGGHGATIGHQHNPVVK